jgi:predicted PolB exonuclease-like 3'-5' exonuclease
MNKNNLFYFDIETVGNYKDLKTLQKNDEKGYELFMKKFEKNPWMHESGQTAAQAYEKYSPISSTYGKIVCVSFGYFHEKNEEGHTINSIFNHDEEELMKQIQKLFHKVSKKHLMLSGFNINGFDIPWLVHKLNKYNLAIPPVLKIYGKKPWEIHSFDLFNEWKSTYSTYKFMPSFDEVCYELSVPSPKDKIDGSKVHHTYWYDDDLNTVVEYCEGDVYSTMLVAEKMLMDETI